MFVSIEFGLESASEGLDHRQVVRSRYLDVDVALSGHVKSHGMPTHLLTVEIAASRPLRKGAEAHSVGSCSPTGAPQRQSCAHVLRDGRISEQFPLYFTAESIAVAKRT